MPHAHSVYVRRFALLLSIGLTLPASCTYHTTEPAAECHVDAECDDGLSCNGQEVCRKEACQPGSAVTCSAPDQCFEQPTGPVCASLHESMWLVFVHSDHLYGVNFVGEGIRTPLRLDVGLRQDEVIARGSVAWSPDGTYVTFGTEPAAEGERDAGAGDASAAGDAATSDAAAAPEASTPDAGADSGNVAREGGIGPARSVHALYVVDLSGIVPSAPRLVIDANVPYAWAPDGSALLVSDSTRSLFVVNRSETGFESAVRLTPSLPLGVWGLSAPYHPTLNTPIAMWSPKSDEIAFLSDSSLSVVSATAGAEPPARAVFPIAQLGGYAWSPDGSRLLANRGNALVLDGGTEGSPLAASAEWAAWSPDSRYVAYSSGSTTSVVDTKEPGASLLAARFNGEPCWSRDSSTLLISDSGENLALYHVSRRATKTLPYNHASREAVCWSPQERYVPVLTMNGAVLSFVVLDGEGVRRSSASDAEIPVTRVWQSGAIAVADIFRSRFAANDSALTFVAGSRDEQDLTLVKLGDEIDAQVITSGENLVAEFSAGAGFLWYTSGDHFLDSVAPVNELFLVDVRDGQSRAPQRIAPNGASGFFSDVSWQPARVTASD